MPSPARPTRTLLAKLKREAKRLARGADAGGTHSAILERLSREAGYESWHALRTAVELPRAVSAEEPTAMLVPLVVDPSLPRGFDNRPNEERSRAELDVWWDRPYALTRPDGRFEVRCLDGGAWDRSTHYGIADSLDAAAVLATTKLQRAQQLRRMPTFNPVRNGRCQVVRPPLRPDWTGEVLHEAASIDAAVAWLHANSAYMA